MVSQALTIRAAAPRLVMQRALERECDQEVLLSRSKLTLDELSDPENRVPREKLSRLWIAIEEIYGFHHFGLEVGQSVKLGDLGVLGYSMRNSKTLGRAMTKLSRFGTLLSDDVRITIHPDDDAPRIRLEASIRLIAIRHPIHCRLAIILSIARELTTPELNPQRIYLPELLSETSTSLQKYFRCEITFQSQDVIVVFNREDWDQQLKSHDAKLEEYLDDYAAHLVRKQPDSDDLVKQIEYTLSTRLSNGDPGLPSIAQSLDMSVRSVQRHLSAARTSYKHILDDYRRKTALDLLSDHRQTIQDVAKSLGYHEPSGFYRAFHRWMGCPPNRYRDQQTAEQH